MRLLSAAFHAPVSLSLPSPEWLRYWCAKADGAAFVILFDSDEDGFYKSEWCRQEKNWCQNHKPGKYMSVGGLMDNKKSAEDVADYIASKVKSGGGGGGCAIM